MASRALSRIARSSISRRLILYHPRPEPLLTLCNSFHSRGEPASNASIKWLPCSMRPISRHFPPANATLQRFGFSSSASPGPTEKEKVQSEVHDPESTEGGSYSKASEQTPNAGYSPESAHSKSPNSKSVKRRRSTKRTAFSDSDTEADLSIDDLVKLVVEKEELLKLKHKEIEKMQDKVLRSYAEMENVLDRTKREAENSKKFAIQNFAKSLLDVADNLGRASSVVKESFSKIDSSKDSAGAVPLLKTLFEGVEMTEKQLAEVFKKFGVEKFDPTNEHFDPHRHHAVFQIPDSSKPAGTVVAVLKPGYMLHDRVLRPAEVGVTETLADDAVNPAVSTDNTTSNFEESR